MKEYIDQVRTDTVRNLLVRTSLPIQIIAEEMRFESQEELSRFFKRTAARPRANTARLRGPCPTSSSAKKEG